MRAVEYVPGTRIVLVGGNDKEGLSMGGTRDGSIWVFKPEDQVPSQRIWAYVVDPGEVPGDISGLAPNPTAHQIATGTTTGSGFNDKMLITASVHILDLSTGKLIAKPLDGAGFGAPDGLAYTPDGRYLIVGHGNIWGEHPIHLLDTKTYKIVDVVHASGTIYAVDPSPDGKYFAVGAGDHIYVWSLKSDSGR